MDYIAHQASLSMGFPRQEYWSGLPFPLQRIFPNQGSKLNCRQLPYCWATRESPWMGLMPFKRGSRGLLIPFHTLRTQQEGSGYESGRGLSPEWDHAVILILDFLAPRTLQNKFPLFISYPFCGILLQWPEWIKTERVFAKGPTSLPSSL